MTASEDTTLWLDLDGAHNVRDVGGLRAATGRVRPGVLLRGDHLEDLTDAAAQQLCEVTGLRGVVDLRAPIERPTGGAWMEGRAVERLHLPLVDLTQQRNRPTVREDGEFELTPFYATMLEGAGETLVRILDFIVAPDRTPTLVHCAAGKDRTGITVAVLLAAAGVDEEDIVADYTITGLRLIRIRTALEARGGYRGPQVPTSPARLDDKPIRAVLEALDRAGGAAAFLRAHGASDAAVTRWQELIIEPTAG